METILFTIEALVKCLVVITCVMVFFMYVTWGERKILGRMQLRYGPNRAGKYGLLQPFADAIKNLMKEDVVPTAADKAVFVIAPMISVFAAISMFAVIPFGSDITILGRKIKFVIADVNIGILYVFAIATIGEYGIVLGGWSSGNKYGVLGSLRAAAQMISYEVTLGLIIIGTIILAGSLKLSDIVQAQYQMGWFVLYQPLPFLLYLIAGLAEINRTPFDMPESESELACGFNIEYSSMKFAMYMLAEYVHMITVAAIVATFFLGGWHGPGSTEYPLLGPIWFFIKICAVIFFFIWERATMPRLRYDHIMAFCWKILLPLALANVVGTALWAALR
jgi:NADH-quinone oxidoreductase subunit H